MYESVSRRTRWVEKTANKTKLGIICKKENAKIILNKVIKNRQQGKQ